MRSSVKTQPPMSGAAVLLCTLVLVATPFRPAAAQSAKKASPSATKSQAAAKAPAAAASRKPAAKTAPLSAEEIAARQQVLESSDWKNTAGEFRQWLGRQTLYDADQVAQITSRLDAGIKRMTADQMNRFMSSMRTKMTVFTSERAEDAQNYLDELLEVASPAYAKRVRQKFPDPLLASAQQIDHSLTMLVSKRQSTAEMQKRFDLARQQVVEYNKAQATARQHDIAREQQDLSSPSPPPLNTNKFDYPIGDAFNTGWDGQAGVTWSLGGYRF